MTREVQDEKNKCDVEGQVDAEQISYRTFNVSRSRLLGEESVASGAKGR